VFTNRFAETKIMVEEILQKRRLSEKLPSTFQTSDKNLWKIWKFIYFSTSFSSQESRGATAL